MSKYDRDIQDVYAVKQLGDAIGYGHLMAIAHELWARHLESKGLPRTGAHVVVGFPMVKDEYQADAIRDQIYTIIVSKALDEADTPQTERRTDRGGDVWEWRGDAWYCIGQANTPQTESTGSPIGDYRDGVGAWQTERSE